MINKIIDETGVKIDIDDDGSVYIATPDEAAAAKARRIIEGIAKDIEVGEVYMGKVVRMMNFGVFVELLPGKDGMVHISKLAKGRVEKCEDVVKIGDELEVKVAEIDSQGRINLIRNDIEYDNTEMPRRVRRVSARRAAMQTAANGFSNGAQAARSARPFLFRDKVPYVFKNNLC